MQAELWILIFLTGVVTLGFGYLLRFTREPALRYWAGAWGLVLADQLISAASRWTSDPRASEWLLDATYFTSPIIPFLLLAGALAYSQRPVPPWLRPLALAVGTVRAGLAVGGHEPVAYAVSIVTEVPASGIGALVIYRALPEMKRRTVPVLLLACYGAVAVIEGTSAITLLAGTSAPGLAYFAVGVIFTMSGLQLIAILNRVDEREQESRRLRDRDLDLLRRLARMSGEHERVESLVRAALDLLQSQLAVDGLGIWLRGEEPGTLVRIAGFGPGSEVLSRFPSIRVDHPLVHQAVTERSAVFAGPAEQEPSLPRALRETDIEAFCVLPLCFGDEVLGVLLGSVTSGGQGGEIEQTLLEAVVEELAVAVHHAAALEERAAAAARLSAEQTRLRSVLEAAPVGVVMADPDGNITVINALATEAARSGEDPEAWVGRPFAEFAASLESAPQHGGARLLPEDPSAVVDSLELTLAGGRILLAFTTPVEAASGETIGRVWVLRDVTEERHLEEQLRQSQKLEALGQLVGGIAHDFNNQLTTILGNTRYLLGSDTGSGETREVLQDVEFAADHCAALTRSLLAFSRRAPVSPGALRIDELFDAAGRLLRPMLPKSIALEMHTEWGLPPIHADFVQLQQILVNLAINARDAMQGEGVLEISARARPESHAVPGEAAKPGRFLEISVADTGPGIPPEIRERIFEPFFTTKPVGEGTGLGLSTCYGAVQSHGGWMEVDSPPDGGSVFRVLLPFGEEGADADLA